MEEHDYAASMPAARLRTTYAVIRRRQRFDGEATNSFPVHNTKVPSIFPLSLSLGPVRGSQKLECWKDIKPESRKRKE
jgi:hypothetical protein